MHNDYTFVHLLHLHIHTHLHTYTPIHLHTYTPTIPIYLYTYTPTYTYTPIYIYIYIYVYVYVCRYEREANIMKDNLDLSHMQFVPDAQNLIQLMLMHEQVGLCL